VNLNFTQDKKEADFGMDSSVSEKMLKANLQNQEENASNIMAQMIIERQLEKIKTRERYRSSDDVSEDEKW